MRQPPYDFKARDRTQFAFDTARSFQRMAELADQGRLIGGAGTVFDEHAQSHEYAVGYARANPRAAHYGAARLEAMLLWLDEEIPESVGDATD